MAFWTYILRCADGRYYTGHTDDMEVRIPQHQTGGYCRFTSARRPVELVWFSEFPNRIEALEAEQQIKKWSQAKKEALIRGDWQLLSHFALPPKERETRSPFVSSDVETHGAAGPKFPFVSSEVETRQAAGSAGRPSTSLGTNGKVLDKLAHPFVSSEVETRGAELAAQPPPASGRGLE